MDRPRGVGLHALRYPQFRYIWFGQVGTVIAQMMDMVTRGWLIYSMTRSPLHLAAVMALRALPLLLFGLFAGVLADRFNRRTLLMFTQYLNLVLNLLMGALLVAGWMQVWIVYATSVGAGMAMAIQQPARNAMVPAAVPSHALQNAVVLNSAALNVGQAIGPAVGGVLAGLTGLASTFFLQAALFGSSILFTRRLSPEIAAPPPRRGHRSIVRSLGEGLGYVRTNRLVLAILVLATIPMFFVNPVQSVAPIFAEEVLDVGPEGAGMLLGAMGAGTIIASLVLMFLPTLTQAGRVVIVMTLLYGASITAFAISEAYVLSLVLMFAGGVCLAVFRTLNQTMIARYTDRAYLGRVNSVYLLDRGLIPLGTVFLGVLIELTGAPAAVAAMGIACVVLTLAFALRLGSLWTIREPAPVVAHR